MDTNTDPSASDPNERPVESDGADAPCGGCGAPWRGGRAFCPLCGGHRSVGPSRQTIRELRCGGCGAALGPDQAFCRSCGSARPGDPDTGDRSGRGSSNAELQTVVAPTAVAPRVVAPSVGSPSRLSERLRAVRPGLWWALGIAGGAAAAVASTREPMMALLALSAPLAGALVMALPPSALAARIDALGPWIQTRRARSGSGSTWIGRMSSRALWHGLGAIYRVTSRITDTGVRAGLRTCLGLVVVAAVAYAAFMAVVVVLGLLLTLFIVWVAAKYLPSNDGKPQQGGTGNQFGAMGLQEQATTRVHGESQRRRTREATADEAPMRSEVLRTRRIECRRPGCPAFAELSDLSCGGVSVYVHDVREAKSGCSHLSDLRQSCGNPRCDRCGYSGELRRC